MNLYTTQPWASIHGIGSSVLHSVIMQIIGLGIQPVYTAMQVLYMYISFTMDVYKGGDICTLVIQLILQMANHNAFTSPSCQRIPVEYSHNFLANRMALLERDYCNENGSR